MTKVRVKYRSHTRNTNGGRKVYEVGDTFNATEAELSAFGDKLEVVESESANQSSSSGSPTDESESDEESPDEANNESEGDSEYSYLPEITNLTVEESQNVLEDTEYSSDDAEYLHEQEKNGSDRVMVHRAIDEYQ